MLKIRNLKEINEDELSFDYSCDGGEWGKARYSFETRKYTIDEYSENDTPESVFFKRHFNSAIKEALELGRDKATVMWY